MCDCSEEEIWKPIEGYEYEVSSCGRVRDEGGIFVNVKNYQTKYPTVRLPNKTMSLRKLLSVAFLQKPDSSMKLINKNGDYTNNHVSNLVWEKKKDLFVPRVGKTQSWPVEQWSTSGELVKKWDCVEEASEALGTTKKSVLDCCSGKYKSLKGFVWKRGEDEDLDCEDWKLIEKGKILGVSNMGRILLKGGVKTYGRKDQSGYRKYSSFLVHRLVADAFCRGKTEEKNCVNHIDSNKENNRADNLEFCTHSWNTRHSYTKKRDLYPTHQEDTKEEKWKDIDGFKGYKVSEKGRIIGPEGFILASRVASNSLKVSIKGKDYMVKRFVADAFLPVVEGKNNVHCIDGNVENVSLKNLERSEHGKETNRKKYSRKNGKIVQMTKDGEVIETYCSVEDVVSKNPLFLKTNLLLSLQNKRESYNGFVWKWESTIDLPGEQWENVTWKNRKYTVSSFGRLLLPKGKKTFGGVVSHGYMAYNGQAVHRIVAAAFLPPPLPSQTVVNHKDGNKQNNRIENLEWCTQSANIRHAHKTGLISLSSREEFRNK